MNSDYFLIETTFRQMNSFYISRDYCQNSINKWLLCPWKDGNHPLYLKEPYNCQMIIFTFEM